MARTKGVDSLDVSCQLSQAEEALPGAEAMPVNQPGGD
jgi:hypothetical protein